MSHLKTEIILNASKEKVWKVLTELQNYQNWNPFIISSGGEAIIGQRITNKMLIKRKTTVFRPVVTKADPHREFEWLGSGFLGMFKGRHYFILEDMGNNQTRLTHGEKFSGLLSGLILRMIRDETLKNFQAMNKALKEVVEK
jgi:hypothetical protein